MGGEELLNRKNQLLNEVQESSLRNVAGKYGVSHTTIWNIVKELDGYISKAYKKLLLDRRNRIITQLYEANVEVSYISDIFKLSESTIRKLCQGKRPKTRRKPGFNKDGTRCQKCKNKPYAKGFCQACYVQDRTLKNLKK